jgi:hypothetical protein
MRKEEIEERENRNAETILLDWIRLDWAVLLGKAHYKLFNPKKNRTRTKISWLCCDG